MGLLDLPSELIATIFAFLDDDDVFLARRTNKDLERASFSHFGKRFFRKKGFMITSTSLDVLEQIAQHNELRKYVQHAWFNPDCYTFDSGYQTCTDECEVDDLDEPPDLYASTRSSHSDLCRQRFSIYKSCIFDHHGLLHSHPHLLTRRLTLILQNLPHLVTMGMRRSEDYNPYGWRQLLEATGSDPRVLGPIPSGPTGDLSSATKLFVAIINALADTGTRLERLYTDAIELDNVLQADLSRSQLEVACASMLYVELNIVKARLSHSNRTDALPFNPLTDPAEYGWGLAQLLRAIPNLKELGLQIFPDRKQSHLVAPSARDPESWRISYPYLSIERLACETSLPNLTRIKLEKVTTTSNTLATFLKPSAANLTSLKIRDIRLLSSEQDPRPWQSLFAFLLEHCLNLGYILLYHLMYERGGVSFIEEEPEALANEDELLVDHVPQTLGGNLLFTSYNYITLEVHGKDDIRQKLEEVVTRHWYHPPLFSYGMDEELWHTDTSDEEW